MTGRRLRLTGDCARNLVVFVVAFFAGVTAGLAETDSNTDINSLLPVSAYGYPDDAFFVAVDGSDAADGSISNPFRTISFAVRAAGDGATIVVRQGVYRESVPTIDKPLTIQSYPNEEVWLKGSVVASEWTRVGSGWQWGESLPQLDRNTHEPGSIDPGYPLAGFPEMAFFDGQSLVQVEEIEDLRRDSFFVNPSDGAVFIGRDPSGHVVEIAKLSQAMHIRSDGVAIRGLGFMHYAGARLQGMLQIEDSSRVSVENNAFVWGAARGLALYRGRGATIKGNVFAYNGLMGLAAWLFDDLSIENNRFIANNQERFVHHGTAAEAAGAKLTTSRGIEIRNNVFDGNLATGLWLDLSTSEAVIVGNRIVGNASYGLYHEISANAVIASNLIAFNDTGIRLSNASHVRVYNNTLIENAESVAVLDDSRVNTDTTAVASGLSHVTADIHIANNVFANCEAGPNPLLWVRDFNSVPLKSAAEMIVLSDGNVYCEPPGNAPSGLISWWSYGHERTFRSLRRFRAATGFESHGVEIDGGDGVPIFVGDPLGDYRLNAAVVSATAPVPLPASVAAALGIETDEVIGVGILAGDRVGPAAVDEGRRD